MSKESVTDSGKRLSDADKDALRLRIEGKHFGDYIKVSAGDLGALLDETALTANRGSVSEERIAMIIQNSLGRHLSVDDDKEIDGTGPASYEAARAIQQAVSECSGGGACCEGMREKAAKHVLSLRELGGGGGYNTALEYAAKEIRALPLPVSADGRAK